MENWWIRWAEAWARILAERWMAEQKRNAKSKSGTSSSPKEIGETNDGSSALPSQNDTRQ